jgi:hypothetical protein
MRISVCQLTTERLEEIGYEFLALHSVKLHITKEKAIHLTRYMNESYSAVGAIGTGDIDSWAIEDGPGNPATDLFFSKPADERQILQISVVVEDEEEDSFVEILVTEINTELLVEFTNLLLQFVNV